MNEAADTKVSGGAEQGALELWRLVKIDIRSPVSTNAWPVARVELEHPERGRVTDIGSAPGAFDAAFKAVSHIVGVSGDLLSYEVRSAPPAAGQSLGITVDVALEIKGTAFQGSSTGVDLVRCSLQAWLQAAERAQQAGAIRP